MSLRSILHNFSPQKLQVSLALCSLNRQESYRDLLMKRKERNLLLRILNAISAVVIMISTIYIFVWELSVFALAGVFVPLCCIAAPASIAGEGALEIVFGITEALLHAVVDAVIGVLEAIGNAFSSIS